MLRVSEEYTQNILADSRDMPYRVHIGATDFRQEQVPSMVLTESMSGGSGVAIGTANSAELTLTIRDPELKNYDGLPVHAMSGLVLPSGSIEWVSLGMFWVTKTTTNNDYKTVKLTCADGMYRLTDEYVSYLVYPAHIRDVVLEIAEQGRVEFVEPEVWPDVMVRVKPEGMTLRNAIGHAAGCCGCNARFNRLGQLEFAWYQDTGIVIDRRSQYLDGMTKLHDKPLDVNFEVTGEVEKYKVIINPIDEKAGRVTADQYDALEGDYIFIDVKLNKDYQLNHIEAFTKNGTPVEITETGKTLRYVYTQPDSDVTVTAYPVYLNSDNLYYTKGTSEGEGAVYMTMGNHGGDTAGLLFAAGERVEFSVHPAEGYKLAYVEGIPYVDIWSMGIGYDGFEHFTFNMPAYNVQVVAHFVPYDSQVMMMSMRSDEPKTDSVTLEYTNPMIYEKMVPAIQEAVHGVTYTPAKVKHRGNPAFQAGDIITVPDGEGVEHKVLIMQQTMSFGGGMNSEVTCPGQTSKSASFNSNGPLNTQVKQEVDKSIKELASQIGYQYEQKLQDATYLLGAEIDDVNKDVVDLTSRVNDAEDRIDDIERNMIDPEEFEKLQSTVKTQGNNITSLTKRVTNLEPLADRVTDVESDVDDLLERVGVLEEGVDPETETRIGKLEASEVDLRARVRNVETGLEEESVAREEAIAAIKQVPDGGTAGQVLMQTEDGTAEWKDFEQKQTTVGLDFSQWDNGSFTETVAGDDAEHVYSVEFDNMGRPVTITDESGQALSIKW